MVQVVIFDIGGGYKVVYMVKDGWEFEEVRNCFFKKYGKVDIKLLDVNDVLRKYGFFEDELKRFVFEFKFQLEFIMKLRKKLIGFIKYDLKFYDVEVFVIKMFEVKEFKGVFFEGDIQRQFESFKKSFVVWNEKGWVVENGQLKLKFEMNIGIKIVLVFKLFEKLLIKLVSVLKLQFELVIKVISVEFIKRGINKGFLVFGFLVGVGVFYYFMRKR